MTLQAPFPYFGGKARIANTIWETIGPVKGYIEPFAGSIAVSLACPYLYHLRSEVLNDLDGMITNTWRSIKYDPEDVKNFVDWPMNELDFHSRSTWIDGERKDLVQKLRQDPHYHDPKIAGWYIWGLCASIGDAFIKQKKAIVSVTGPRGVFAQSFDPDKVFSKLSTRLKDTRITCGDWKRVVRDSVITFQEPTAVFLDPPYAATTRHDTYACESYSVASEVNEWCTSQTDNNSLRIVLAGYEGDYELPPSWGKISWKTSGGYGNIQRVGEAKQGRENASKEMLWVSPSCITDTSFLDSFK